LGVRSAVARSASSPGRVTLLGEHTDYNAGRSLAVATEQRTRATVAPAAPGSIEVRSAAVGTVATTLKDRDAPAFVRLAAALVAAADVEGATIDVDGDLPVGAGLSSSAAYAVAVAIALDVPGDALELARACQDAERLAGSEVGLLDQLVALSARSGEVVALDFAVPLVTSFALHPAIGLSVVDTGVRRRVGETAYARRRAECEAAARALGPLGRAEPAAVQLLDDELLRRRARHVVTECARVDAAVAPLSEGDLVSFGTLLDEAHASLRDDFEASTPAVEAVRDEVRALRGVAGVRLCGAGFGGAVVVAHDPDVEVGLPGRWSARVRPGAGAALSSSS
jgi:galactokinase